MSSLKQTATGTAGIFIVLGIIIAANVILNQIRAFRMDLTEENLYTLSEGTTNMMGLPGPDVTLKFYFSKSSETTPIQLKQYAQRIRDLLREYETHSKGRVVLETYDPKPDSDEEEWAQKYGIQGQGLSMLGGDAIYLGLAAVSGKREAAIPFIDPRVEPQLEYLVTRLVSEVSVLERPKVGLMSSLPVMGTPQMPFNQSPQQGPQKWVFVSELEKLYEIVEVDPTAENIRDDLTALLVVHPKDLGEKTLFAIDQFVMNGGRLMAFLDPMCLADDTAQPQMQQFGPPQSASDLNRLTKTWGIELQPGKIAADEAAPTQLNTGRGVSSFITFLSLGAAQIDREEVATSSLESIMMPFAGALTGEPAAGLTMTKLLQTSEDSGTLDTMQAMGPASAAVQAMVRRANIPLGIRLQGTFKSAFPEGPPKGEEEKEEEENGNWLKESKDGAVVILITDADMLADGNCVRMLQTPFGPSMASPLNDNLNLVANFTEQLAGSEALIGLRSRGTFERPFTKVAELEQAAQSKWLAEEKKLQDELMEAQNRINELQRGKQADQQFIISPEQQAEIKKFNDQRFETQRQLKEVRKNLRHDIEVLGMKLKIINIAAVPLAVALFGIVRGVRRKKSGARKS